MNFSVFINGRTAEKRTVDSLGQNVTLTVGIARVWGDDQQITKLWTSTQHFFLNLTDLILSTNHTEWKQARWWYVATYLWTPRFTHSSLYEYIANSFCFDESYSIWHTQPYRAVLFFSTTQEPRRVSKLSRSIFWSEVIGMRYAPQQK